MNAPAPEAPASPPLRRRRRLVTLLLAGYFIPACGVTLFSGGALGFVFVLPVQLAAGIVTFPRRVLPHVTVDRPGVLAFGVSLALLTFALYTLLRALKGAGPRRPLRAVLLIVAGALTLFVAAMAVAGAAHQVGWLLTTRESLTLNPWRVAPCALRRSGASARWLERWRPLPLDGEPPLATRHYIAVLRDPGDPASEDQRPHVCGGEASGGLSGEPIDEARMKALLDTARGDAPPP
jgi:hypothetical protein